MSEVARIETALRHVPPGDRGTWCRMGMAIKDELDESGFHIWDSWSQGAENYKERDARATWKSFRGSGVGIGTLFKEAQAHGYKPTGPYQRPSPAELERHRKEREARLAADRERETREREAAAIQAGEFWKRTATVDTHAYLTAKNIKPNGAKLYRGPLAIGGMKCDGSLVIPIRNAAGELCSLEFINPEGEKRYLPNGAKSGNYFSIGKPDGRIVVAEGFATGASIHERAGYAVAVAFDAGNLEPVAVAIKAKIPEAQVIIAADDDALTVCTGHKQEGVTLAVDPQGERPEWCRCNPGITQAMKAARAVGGRMAVPDFTGSEREAGLSDFNDLGRIRPEAVAKSLDQGLLSVLTVTPPALPVETGWRDPEPLPALPDVAPLNYEALPAVLRDYVRDISERMQCPVDFPAVTCLAMAGAAIGRKIGIRPKTADSWTVVPNLWAMIVGKSGIMKSPAMSEAISPLRRMQSDAFERHELELKDFEVQSRLSKIQGDEAEKRARGLVKDGKTEAASQELENAQRQAAEEPTAARYIVNDSTVEALAETLEENPNGVLVDRDELSGWLRSMDKEGQQEARAFYLTAADGDKGFTTDRIGRGRGRHIQAVCVSIVGGIQPGVLAGYVRETQRGGSGDDGLLQRFGVMVYPDVSPTWKNIDRAPDHGTRQRVDALVSRLCALSPEDVGAEVDEYKPIPFLHFDSVAQAFFDEWRADLEARIRGGDEHPAIISHLAKYRKLIPSLALIGHLCDGGRGPVTEQALLRALTLADYLESHARRVYSYASRPDVDAAKTILAKLRGGKLPAVFSPRQIYRAGWSGLTAPEEARAAIRLLVDFGYLRELPDDDPKGRPSQSYEAHPSARGAS